MSSNYDTSLDSYSDPTATSKLNSPSHSQQHINLNDAVEKIEAKVGVTASAVTTTHDYKLSGVTGSDKASSLAGVETQTNKTFTSPVLNTPVVTNGTFAKPTINASIQGVTSTTPAGAGTTTLDLSSTNVFAITMPAATQTLAISNASVGQYFAVEINNVTSQGALTWFTTIRWVGGTAPTLTGTNGKRDSFMFRVTGSGTYDGYIVGMSI